MVRREEIDLFELLLLAVDNAATQTVTAAYRNLASRIENPSAIEGVERMAASPDVRPIPEGTLEQKYPEINWRAPLQATVGRKSGLLCRYCVAQLGFHGHEMDRLFETEKAFQQHLKEIHNRE